ncbi:pyridoxal phosphate-dependent transferase [Truncatella angustata]|uniref:Pyridoxal phosphate-dependent transferase n=1 Tax=Truncatella angustata TaxID=152316 RepID=A0A9P8UDK1_9PEZI|nr:pyridoxal phosphate-dependent transferase [Truncatella angustata]KAH6647949.1 pyridoxal phosphate-dependent transferase [Truncatella angustata]
MSLVIRGDESYGRNWGYYCLLDTFRDVFERGNNRLYTAHSILTGTATGEFYRSKLLKAYNGGFVNGGPHQLETPNFFIVPQGRCAEFLLFSTLKDFMSENPKGDESGPPIVVSNGFFDTTGANAAAAGFVLETFTQPGLEDPFPKHLIGKQNLFKGNLDLVATEAFLEEHSGQVTLILMTITNNWAAAQPVSMANIRAAAELARRKSIPLFFDACRFAENAWFIHRFEAGYSDKSIPEIVQEMFSYAEGFTISLKKDGLANMGGVLSFRDEGLFAQKYKGIGLRLKERQILFYGNDSYGGMSGRDLMATVAGLYEVTKEPYLRNRIGQVCSFAQKLLANGIPVLSPPGGHAVYLEMNEFFHGCDRQPGDFASVGFTLELLKDYGIRAAEAGPFGWQWDNQTPEERKKIPNLVRFAVPRHVLSDEHINYTVAAIRQVHKRRQTIPNVKITRGKNMRLRHFSCGLKPVAVLQEIEGTYLSEAKRQISHLSAAIGQDETKKELLISALELTTNGWGRAPVPKDVDTSRWVSQVSNDNSPFEYSVVLDQRTGEAELRFLVEAQLSEGERDGNLIQLQENALRLTEGIANEYGTSVSLDRFNLIRDLFMPANPQGKFAAWHSYASGKAGPEWKIYLNPSIASGRDSALAATQTAFEHLGMARAWELVQKVLAPSESVVYFSLDLSPDVGRARVKVYVSHGSTSARDIAQKHVAICPHADAYEIQRFCEIVAGGSLGPYEGKSLLSCFAFTTEAQDRPQGTVHFPIDAYADNDEDAQGRIERYLAAVSASALCRERYRRIISAVQRRPLDQGPGIQSWISLKQEAGGKQSNAFYISPGLFIASSHSRLHQSFPSASFI